MNQKNWVKLLDVAHLYYNFQKCESWGHSSFEVVIRQQLLMSRLFATEKKGRPPFAYQFVRHWYEQMELAEAFLYKAANMIMK